MGSRRYIDRTAGGVITASVDEINILDGVTASASELNRTTNLGKVQLSLPLPGTLNYRTGVPAYGNYHCKHSTSAVNHAKVYDDSAGTFTDWDALVSTDGDGGMTLPTFDTSDYLAIGNTDKWAHAFLDMTTAGAGDAVTSETSWEYWNGSAWTALTFVEDDSTALTAGTSQYTLSFYPPEDWATTTLDGDAAYYIRMVSSADDVYNTTAPILDRILKNFILGGASVNIGTRAPATGTIVSGDYFAVTRSGGTQDTVFALVNLTTGDTDLITWTKQNNFHRETLNLSVNEGDQIGLLLLQEEGSTEYADASISLLIDVDAP